MIFLPRIFLRTTFLKILAVAFTSAACFFSIRAFANEASPQLVLDETLWLHVPTVEYEGMPGYYQNVHFMMTQGGPWKLISFEAAVQITTLDRVEVIKTTEHPVQVFLEIDGTFAGGCREIGEVAVSLHEDEFVVGMYFSEESIRPEEPIDCTDAIRPFTEVVQLPVYGIEAGGVLLHHQ